MLHRNEDIQVDALRALGALKDSRALDFLLIYASYMAVFESGSERATIHGIIHKEIRNTLASITGLDLPKVERQDPARLTEIIGLVRRWQAKNEGR